MAFLVSLAPTRLDRLEEVLRLQESGERVHVLDARSHRSCESSDRTATEALRIDPDRAAHEADRLHLPRDAWLIAFCARPNEATSARVALVLRKAGWTRAVALRSGWQAWLDAGLPTEPRPGA